jgi:hypothetical protein
MTMDHGIVQLQGFVRSISNTILMKKEKKITLMKFLPFKY